MWDIKQCYMLALGVVSTLLLACSEEQGGNARDSLALVDSERVAERHMEVMEAIRADSACQYLKGLPERWPDVFLDSTYMHGDDSCVINIVDSVFYSVFEVKGQLLQKELDKLIGQSDGYLSEYIWLKFIEQISLDPFSVLKIVVEAHDNGLNNIPLCLVRALHFERRRRNPDFDSPQIQNAFSSYLNKKTAKNEKEFVQRMYDSIFSKSDYIWEFN